MRVARDWMVAVAAGSVAVLAGCGGGGDDGGPVGNGNPVFTTFVVTPAATTVLVGRTQALTATARDQNSNAMSGLSVTYTSSDQTKATVTSAGVITGVAEGTAQITATGTIGSVTKTATVQVTVSATAPQSASVSATAAQTFSPSEVTVARNGTVTWTFAIEHNVTFSGTGAPANIPNTASGSVSRTFPNTGTFSYNCTLHPGMSGSVVVP